MTELPLVFPAITSFYAALFALLHIALSTWVMGTRLQTNVLHGDGGNETLNHRMRAQGNFTEHVPLALLLIGLLEADGAGHGLIQVLCIVLLVARLAHPFGMLAAAASPQQYAYRGGGIIATLLVMLVAAIALLVRLA